MFAKILETNLINFIIVISTLVLIFKKAHLGDKIQQMADEIKNSVEKSSKNAQSAIQEYKTTKKQVKDTPELEAQILGNAKTNAQNIKEKIEQKTILDCSEIQRGFEKIKQNQNEKYKNMTLSQVYLAGINLAQDEIMKRMNDDTHKILINSSIDEIDKIEGISLE